MFLLLATIVQVIGQIEFCSKKCQAIKDQNTCEQLKLLCFWNGNICQNGIKPTFDQKFVDIFLTEKTAYCTSRIASCNQVYGCANYLQLCTKFLGCDAYIGYSDNDCYTISYLCTWSQEKKKCVRSSDYDYNGKLNVTRNCLNAPRWFQSKDNCSFYSNQCIYNGYTCTDQLLSCNSYNNFNNCTNLIGLEGQCKNGSSRCEPNKIQIYCQNIDAPQSQSNCQKAVGECYFDGKNCQTQLQNCQNYNINDCQDRIGLDGYCVLEDGQCQILSCLQQGSFQFNTFDKFCQTIQLCVDDVCSHLTKIECQQNNNCQFINNHCIRQLNACEFNSYYNCPYGCLQGSLIVQISTCQDALSPSECQQFKQLNSNSKCFWSYEAQLCQQVTKCSQIQIFQNNQQICQDFSEDCYSVVDNNNCVDSTEQFCYQFNSYKPYCNQQNGCVWVNQQCISLLYDCQNYTKEMECYTDIYQRQCIWKNGKCFRYREHEDLQYEEELCTEMSDKWQYVNGTCTLLPHCNDGQNQIEYGFEGNCNEIFKNQCGDYTNSVDCINSTQFKCYFKDKKCQNLTSCSQLQGITNRQDYKVCQIVECEQYTEQSKCEPIINVLSAQDLRYCQWIAGKCIQTIPYFDQISCLLFGSNDGIQRYYKFEGEYCQPCEEDYVCHDRMISTPEEISSKRILIFIMLILLFK